MKCCCYEKDHVLAICGVVFLQQKAHSAGVCPEQMRIFVAVLQKKSVVYLQQQEQEIFAVVSPHQKLDVNVKASGKRRRKRQQELTASESESERQRKRRRSEGQTQGHGNQ